MQSTRIKISSIVESQLPGFVRNEYPLVEQLLKEYYSSLDSASLPYDLLSNIDQYIKVDNIADKVESTALGSNIDFDDESIAVSSTKGFPKKYGLIKIDNEIILYKSKTDTSFLECFRGFSGVTKYSSNDIEDLEFSTSQATDHVAGVEVQNLSGLVLKQFFGKIKKQFLPGFEGRELYEGIRESTFLKQSKDFYTSKGTSQSFEILFRCLYGEDVKVTLPKDNLIKPSDSIYKITRNFVVSAVQGNPEELENQTIFQDEYENLRKSFGTISKVEQIIRGEEVYYNLQVDSTINNPYQNLKIHSKTHTTSGSLAGSDKLTVDSTLSFENSGQVVVSFNNQSYVVTYTSKTINQFLGCSGIEVDVPSSAEVNINSFAYGFSPTGEEIRFRFNGVISDTNLTDGSLYYNKDDIGRLLSLGYDSNSPLEDNWIINNSVKCAVKSFTSLGGTKYSIETFDPHNIVNGNLVEIDYVDIDGGNGDGAEFTALSDSASPKTKIQVTLPKQVTNIKFVKRKIDITESNGFMSDVLNVYKDFDNDEVYVTSSSLPSYFTNPDKVIDYRFDLTSDVFGGVASGITTDVLTITAGVNINPNKHGLISGDSIVYKSSNETPQLGITTGTYFVNRISSNKINIARSRSDLFAKKYVSFASTTVLSNEYLQLQEYDKQISTIDSQRIVRKFSKPKNSDEVFDTLPGTTGLLVNGVEVLNYKTQDFVYYGELERVDVVSSSSAIDVITPPVLEISSAEEGLENAKGFCGVEGGLYKIDIVDPGFDYLEKPIVSITGGSGLGAKAEVQLTSYEYSSSFDPSNTQLINLNQDQIGFSTYHRFRTGEYVVYKTFGSTEVGGLTDQAKYYVNNVDDLKITLHKTEDDAFSSLNPINLTSYGSGSHTLTSIKRKNKVGSITVLNPGSGYKNKLVKAASSGINTANDTINVTQHPYQSGEVIYYLGGDSNISGLSTDKYIVTRIDEKSFKLSEVGTGETRSNFFYETNQYVNLKTQGSGFHEFNYESIVVTIDGPLGSPSSLPGNKVEIQPVFRGNLDSVSLFDGGVGYGSSEIINFNKQPEISLISGSGAKATPVVSNGKLVDVVVYQPGSGYNSPPDIIISGSGEGAVLTPIIENGQLKEIKVINSGRNYSKNDTLITIINPVGEYKLISYPQTKNINLYQKLFNLFDEDLVEDDGSVYKGRNANFGLQFTHLYAPKQLREILYASDFDNITFKKDIENDTDTIKYHSPLIGWAYDGNPIYGPYGFDSITNKTVRLIKSGYIEVGSSDSFEIDSVPNRPSTILFPVGSFIEDYRYDPNEGDLDENNGRFCVTPEFPQGVYAYFVTLNEDSLEPSFPYIIGKSYHSNLIDFNLNSNSIQDKFDFSNLVRNTRYYNSLSLNSEYEYFLNISKVNLQNSIVTESNSGSVDSLKIVFPGKDYKVGDKISFGSAENPSVEAFAEVSKISGREISQIQNTSIEIQDVELYPSFDRTRFVAFSTTPHNLSQNNIISIDTLNRESLSFQSSFKVNVNTPNELILSIGVTDAGATGIVTYFNVVGNLSYPNLRENDILTINSEKVKVLNIDSDSSRIRVLREQESTVSAQHSAYTKLTENRRKFFIDLPKEALDQKYNLNREIYFDPIESVGIGTTPSILTFSNPGLGITSLEIPERSIYIKNHNLKSGDLVVYNANGGTQIAISTEPIGSPVFLPEDTNLYVTKFSDDLIGLSFEQLALNNDGSYVGVGTTSDLLYFRDEGFLNYHSFTTNYDNSLTGTVNLYKTIVSTATSHSLKSGDIVSIDAKPKNSVTFTVKYDDYNRRLIVNPKDFESSDIDTENNLISIENHIYLDGDKIILTSDDPNLVLDNEGMYYISIFNEDKVKLHNSYYDSVNKINEVGITTEFYGTLSLINPRIDVVRDNIVVFNLGDSSLSENFGQDSAFDFKLYVDDNLSDELISITENVSNLNILGSSNIQYIGNIGVDSTAKVQFTTESLKNDRIYYDLVPIGVTPIKNSLIRDDEVKNNNEIFFVDSVISGDKEIIDVGISSFTFYNNKRDPISLYATIDDNFSYITDSKNDSGPIEETRLVSRGLNYTSLPYISKINTNVGSQALLIPQSTSIGSILTTKIKDIGYNYSSDPTLKPLVKYASKYRVEPLSNVESIRVVTQGFNYITNPDIIFIDPFSKKPIDDLILDYEIGDEYVSILQNTKGIYNIEPEIVVYNNSNGVGISSVSFDQFSKIVTLTLTGSFSTLDQFPFKVNDEIFVEGINITEEISSTSTGYNSDNYDYSVFKVVEIFPNLGFAGAFIRYSLSDYSTINPGTWDGKKTGSVVNTKNFPTFDVTLAKNKFEIEELISNGEITGSVNDWDPNNEYLTVELDRDFAVNDLVIGQSTRSQAFIKDVLNYEVFYEVDSSSVVIEGWKDEIGFLNSEVQRIQDSDYYQNFSYVLESKVQLQDWSNDVNNLNHTLGFKKFATYIFDSSIDNVGIQTGTGLLEATVDISKVVDIECINDFDLVSENFFYVNGILNSDEIVFNSVIILDYAESIGNRALIIDDISDQFSSQISETFVTSFNI